MKRFYFQKTTLYFSCLTFLFLSLLATISYSQVSTNAKAPKVAKLNPLSRINYSADIPPDADTRNWTFKDNIAGQASSSNRTIPVYLFDSPGQKPREVGYMNSGQAMKLEYFRTYAGRVYYEVKENSFTLTSKLNRGPQIKASTNSKAPASGNRDLGVAPAYQYRFWVEGIYIQNP